MEFFSFYRNLVSLFLELILNERHQNSLFFQANTKSWKILVYKLYMEVIIPYSLIINMSGNNISISLIS